MHRLRDAGNSLVVVEHDPQIMLAADRLLDLGPGAGERGGEIVAFDTPEAVRANPRSLTGQYLSGAKQVAPRAPPHRSADTASRAPCMVPAQRAIKLTRRTRAQSQEHRCGVSAAAAGVYHRRVGLGQIHAHRGCAAQGHAQGAGPAERDAGRLRSSRRRGHGRRRGHDRPELDRPYHALQSRELRRRIRRGARTVRQRRRGEGARLHARHVQLQFRHGPLPHLQRQRLRARGDAVPVGRVPALPGLRRQALSRRDAGDPPRRRGRHAQEHRRRAQHDGHRGAGVLQEPFQCRGAAAAAGGRGPRIREARPAGAHAVGRRGAATETRGPSRRGRGRRHAVDPRQAVPVRRADHRPALRRRRQTTARVPQAAQDRSLAASSSSTTST